MGEGRYTVVQAAAERIVFAFVPLGEAIEAAILSDLADAATRAGQNLAGTGLVAYVPNQPVARRVEDVVERHGQFNDAKPGAEVAARLGRRIDGLGAQFIGKLCERFVLSARSYSGVEAPSSRGFRQTIRD